jgi:hypothetical protein
LGIVELAAQGASDAELVERLDRVLEPMTVDERSSYVDDAHVQLKDAPEETGSVRVLALLGTLGVAR